MHLALRYWRAIRSAALESYNEGIGKTLEFWTLVVLIAMGVLGAFFLSLYRDEARWNSEFEQYAVATVGYVVDEQTCSNGTRFGHEYCYDILFTTPSGEEVIFGARGLVSYRAGFRILQRPMPVQYLPYRPTSARLVGARNDEGFLLGLGLAINGLALFCLLGFIYALYWRHNLQELLKQLEDLMARRCYAEAADFSMAVPNTEYRDTLLATLILRLFELKEVQQAQNILARENLPDLKKAFQAQGMELRYGPAPRA
ncbi:MAG: DUF3592 domain-containing protein [Pseudomonas sp.]|uniref:DUF3592 domain-containing protein n=1 Tax=Pseudomonas sp. TaxID=306 RepID=UPI003D0CC5AE